MRRWRRGWAGSKQRMCLPGLPLTDGWAGWAICRLEPGPVRPVWIQEPHTRWRGNCLVQRFSQLLADHLRPSEIAETTDAGPKLTAPTKRLVGLVAGVWAGPGAGVR